MAITGTGRTSNAGKVWNQATGMWEYPEGSREAQQADPYYPQQLALEAAQPYGQNATGQTVYDYALNKSSAAPGGSSIVQPAYERQQQSLLDAELARQQWERQNTAREQQQARALAALGGSTSGGGLPRIEYDTAGEQQANAAAFARAKEMSGQNAQAAIQALKGAMEGRGLTGSTVEGQAMGGVIGGAGQGISNVIREQAIQDAQANARKTQTKYQGDITQRGQDLEAQRAIYSLIGGLY